MPAGRPPDPPRGVSHPRGSIRSVRSSSPWRTPMAAVMITDQPAPPRRHVTGTGPRRPGVRLVAVPDPAPRVRPTTRVSAATFRRRRLGALVGVAAVVFLAGRAGAALGSDTLAAPERGPWVTRYVVH